ncbi:probable serine/threonine-protein kinase kinX isoform X3 [Ochlerotatus camptorhynchus]|uniref:probable serine/threonine-protein kinase kinX isoform X3 n=1 Tax=Ochlerotatus camptorhynchus TaxID=644619 RepID=UPI0031D47A36
MESKSAEDTVKDIPELAAEVESAADEEEVSPLEVKPTADDSESAAGDSATATTANKEKTEEKDRRPSEEKKDDEAGAGEETKTDEASKVESVASPRLDDEHEEKFEDAVDSEEKLQGDEATEPAKDSLSDATLTSVSSSSVLKTSPSEYLPSLGVAKSYEIEDSPEKSPNKPATPSSVAKPRPGPSSVSSTTIRQLSTIKSPEIETVELDDDDDDDEDGYDAEEVAIAVAAARYDDEEDDFEEDDEDDYFEDPDSDDKDVSQVIQGAIDEMNAIDDQESGEDDKMDVSSDEDDYSEDDDQPSVVVPRSVLSGKRKRDDYSEEEEIYDNDEYIDEPEEDEDDDGEVEEVIELDGREGGRKPLVSMGQISVEDESDEDVVLQEKKKSRKVKYKSYEQKVMARIRRRTYKLLNKRSMHVMEEGSDALVCSDATKIVSLKSTVSSVGAKTTTAAEEVSIKDPKSKEEQTITPGEVERKDSSEEALVASGDAAKAVSELKKDDENKENMTVKDNSKEVPRRVEVDEKAKVKDEEKVEKKDRKLEKLDEDELAEDIMDSIDDIVADAKKQNGSKSDFNDELTFQMDVDESEKDYEDDEDEHEEDEDDEDEEEGAVDLSSSYDANKSDRQTDDSDAIEMIDSSPEKDSSVVGIKPTRKLETLQLDKSPSDSRKGSPEKVTVVVKQEIEDDSERIQESTKEAPVSASKSSREEKQSEKPRETEAVSRKRRRSVDPDDREEDDEPLVPSKKLKRELESNYPTHDRLLKEYIETTSNRSVGDIQKHTDALMVEIQTLNEMIRAKEIEWNNMIHLKKVKEEILLRLTRKKHVMDVMETKLGEVSEYTHFDSSNLTNVRSASVGPRPPTPPPEVDIRPASVTPLHSSTLNTSKNANVSTNSISSSRQLPGSKDNSLFAQFNHINSSVTMVPLSTSSSSLITSTNTILQSRANMKSSEVAKEKPNAAQIQRQILPKPILSNHQQILNNLAISAGLTAAGAPNTSANSISTSSTTASVASAANILAGLSNNILAHTAALLNGHHHPSNHLTQSQVNQLQVGRQGVIKDVKSIIADYRQKHPEQVPRRGRRLKNIPSSGYEGITITNKSGSSRMPELGFLLAEDDEADDSVDRLVIDEGDDHHGTANNPRNDGHRESSGVVITTRGGNGPEFHENDVPECQGCKKREAQFVCAGCGNQWYCSRECQVNAWDDHSEVCTG